MEPLDSSPVGVDSLTSALEACRPTLGYEPAP